MKKIMLLLVCGMSVAIAQPVEANIQSTAKVAAAGAAGISAIALLTVTPFATLMAVSDVTRSGDFSEAQRGMAAVIIGLISGTVGAACVLIIDKTLEIRSVNYKSIFI